MEPERKRQSFWRSRRVYEHLRTAAWEKDLRQQSPSLYPTAPFTQPSSKYFWRFMYDRSIGWLHTDKRDLSRVKLWEGCCGMIDLFHRVPERLSDNEGVQITTPIFPKKAAGKKVIIGTLFLKGLKRFLSFFKNISYYHLTLMLFFFSKMHRVVISRMVLHAQTNGTLMILWSGHSTSGKLVIES